MVVMMVMMLKEADMLRILQCMIWFSRWWQRQRWQRHWRLPSTAPAPLQPRRESTSQVAINFFTGYSSSQKLWGMRQASDGNSWQSCRGWYWSSGTKNLKFPKKKVLSGASPAKPASAVQAKPEQKQEEKKVKQPWSIYLVWSWSWSWSKNLDLSIQLGLGLGMSHCQMLGKFEYTLPAKFWRLVGCTEMLSW